MRRVRVLEAYDRATLENMMRVGDGLFWKIRPAWYLIDSSGSGDRAAGRSRHILRNHFSRLEMG
jgi:hypothetical protein